jgi:flagellar hook-length control protein FliK
MSDALLNSLGKGLDVQSLDRSESERKNTLEQAKRWAVAVGEQLSHLPPLPKDMETSDWRAGAGDMTPPQTGALVGSALAGSAADETAKDDENRLIVRVDAGDLGEVALLVDRQKGALRVTIGVQGAAAQAAVEVERAALTQTLQNAGIQVESVNVVRASSFGTVLAPPQRKNASTDASENSERAASDDEPDRRRLARKLNLIG